MGLCRDVEGGHRLVEDHELRVERDGARDADALSLAATQLVRQAPGVGGVEADPLEQLDDLLLALPAVATAECVESGVLSGPALERITNSSLEQVLITNTTPLEEKLRRCPKLRPLSVAPLLGEAIRRIHQNSSVSSLFV